MGGFFVGQALIFLAIVIADQLSKWTVARSLHLHETIPVIPGVFHITYVQNPGAAFGLFAYQRPLFIAVAVLMIGLAIVYRKRIQQESRLFQWAVTIGIAGAMGNLIDRVRTGYVVDFFDFRMFPVFNIADVAITLGVILLIWTTLFDPSPSSRDTNDRQIEGEIEAEGASGREG